jgi:hypothetical protein
MKEYVSCRKAGGNNGPKHRGLPRPYKAACGKTYAMDWARVRHDKQYHGG